MLSIERRVVRFGAAFLSNQIPARPRFVQSFACEDQCCVGMTLSFGLRSSNRCSGEQMQFRQARRDV